jgi:cytoskeletal protein CcmA (bactofilin family)
MFEKNRVNRQDTSSPPVSQDSMASSAQSPAGSGRAAVIGPGIHINGDISGEENLIIEGKVDGKINLGAHQVSVGQSGKVKADITAKVIKIDGEVTGDLKGTEKVVISRSGNVHGNIIAPRMTLEDGAIFKGSIDMDPGEPAKPVTSKAPVAKAASKGVESPKVAGNEKAKENSSYSLNGGH